MADSRTSIQVASIRIGKSMGGDITQSQLADFLDGAIAARLRNPIIGQGSTITIRQGSHYANPLTAIIQFLPSNEEE